jgi:riboflavin biosynthesis pyrimidine reductase
MEAYADLRMNLGRKPRPRLVLLTSTGEVTVSHAAVVAGATIVTTAAGAAAVKDRLPDSCDVIQIGESGPVDLVAAMTELRDRGYAAILTEGGPHVMGNLLSHHLLDEAFITISPVVAGRDREPRLGMVAGVELLPGHGLWTKLLSARRHGDFLFLRYGLKNR